MLGILLRLLAFLLFLFGSFGGSIAGHGQLDLYGWALAAWVLATLVGGWGPAFAVTTRAPE
jgi:hypothetical protein